CTTSPSTRTDTAPPAAARAARSSSGMSMSDVKLSLHRRERSCAAIRVARGLVPLARNNESGTFFLQPSAPSWYFSGRAGNRCGPSSLAFRELTHVGEVRVPVWFCPVLGRPDRRSSFGAGPIQRQPCGLHG